MKKKSETKKCKTCGRLIFWLKTREGNLRPLNAQQVITGNVAIVKSKAIAGLPGSGNFEFHSTRCERLTLKAESK